MKKDINLISGIMPHLTARATIDTVRSETGIGALMPWAGKLWFVTYVAHTACSGGGTGLFEVDETFNIKKHPESVVGTYANRMIHAQSNQAIIGPHLIDTNGNVRTVHAIEEHRLTATMVHLFDPEHMVYFLTMEGLLYEVNVHTLEATLLFDLMKTLNCTKEAKPHFKGGYTKDGSVIVANNTYDEREYQNLKQDGRLAQWDGMTWQIIENNPFNEVNGGDSTACYATGWDKASVIFKAYKDNKWTTYRLPKATQTMDHMILTEWPRIREVETERYLMDCCGMFYELSHLSYENRVWGLRPISTHLRMIPDFCTWNGLLVLAGNQATPIWDSNKLAGEPQSNLWFGKTDDLWNFGKPSGWGGPWWESEIKAHVPSDPYLMTGFDKKCLHLSHNIESTVHFKIEVDFLGNGTWKTYAIVPVTANGYYHHEFPDGFSAHWVRLTSDSDCNGSGYFVYS